MLGFEESSWSYFVFFYLSFCVKSADRGFGLDCSSAWRGIAMKDLWWRLEHNFDLYFKRNNRGHASWVSIFWMLQEVRDSTGEWIRSCSPQTPPWSRQVVSILWLTCSLASFQLCHTNNDLFVCGKQYFFAYRWQNRFFNLLVHWVKLSPLRRWRKNFLLWCVNC